MDIYVFAGHASPDIVDEFKKYQSAAKPKNKHVRYVASVTGPFEGFAVVEFDDHKKLPKLIHDTFSNPGAGDLSTATPIYSGPMNLRYTKQYAASAFVRIRTEPGRALDVLGATAVIAGYNGSAIVAGDFDILLELGADSQEELDEILLYGLHDVDGILWTDTLRVLNYHYRGK